MFVVQEQHMAPLAFCAQSRTYQALFGLGSGHLKENLLQYDSGHALGSSGKGLLCVPAAVEAWLVDIERRICSVMVPFLWNSFPKDTCLASLLAMFRCHIKKELFSWGLLIDFIFLKNCLVASVGLGFYGRFKNLCTFIALCFNDYFEPP